MAALGNDVFDSGLNILTNNSEKLVILSADPGLVYSNIAANSLGSKVSPTVSVPADRSGGGREVTISAISDGNVVCTGTVTATHFALVDDTNSRILASQVLNASQAVTNGNTFSLTALTIGIPDPA